MKVTVSPAAKSDLIEIAIYIAQDNPDRALSFVGELEAKCLKLGQQPGLGTRRQELADGLRVAPHGRYLIFYREHTEGLRIERVMHSARDIGSTDFSDL